MCTELTTKDNEMQSIPASPYSLPKTKSFKIQFSKFLFHQSEKDVNPLTLLTIPQVLILICSILTMIVVLQIPTILHFTGAPSSTNSSYFASEVDFKTCSVSIYMHTYVCIFSYCTYICSYTVTMCIYM